MPKGPEKSREDEDFFICISEKAEKIEATGVSDEIKIICGLKIITPEIAKTLIERDLASHLLNLSQITPEVARIFAKYGSEDQSLPLTKVNKITPEVARELAKCNMNMHFGAIDDIEIIKELLKSQCNNISFELKSTQPTSEVARELAKFEGKRLFIEVSHITPETVRELAKFKGDEIYFNNLIKITPEVARELAKFEDILLDFGDLKRITYEVARELSKSRAKELQLTELMEINVKIYKELIKFKGPLILSPRYKIIYEQSVGRLQAVRSQTPEWLPLFEKNPNFKDIVIEEGAKNDEYLKENGVNSPECFQNLNAKFNAQPAFDNISAFLVTLPNGSGIDAFKEDFKIKNFKEFEDTPEFSETYKDEIIQAMADHLNIIIQNEERKLKKMSASDTEGRVAFLRSEIDRPDLRERVKRRYRKDLENLLSNQSQEKTSNAEQKIQKARELLICFDECHYIKKGQISYKLGSRSTEDLNSGDRCSDCTSAGIGGANFWTVPTWMTDPGVNFLYQYDEEGQLAHKFVPILEVTPDGKILLTIDSSEVANEQKEKAGMYKDVSNKEKEKKLMEEAIQFFHKWAVMMGLNPNNIYASTFSNTGTQEYENYPIESIRMSKLGGLDSPNKILKRFNPKTEADARIYLQSYQDSEEVTDTEEDIEQEDINEVERVLTEFLQVTDKESKDYLKMREIMELASEDPNLAARQMNIFLIREASAETKKLLSIEGKRIDSFLNSKKYSLAKYFKRMMGQVAVTTSNFVISKLYHLRPEGSLTGKEKDEIVAREFGDLE